jgi:hypothetical protein
VKRERSGQNIKWVKRETSQGKKRGEKIT